MIVLLYAGIMLAMDITKDVLFYFAHPGTPLLRERRAKIHNTSTAATELTTAAADGHASSSDNNQTEWKNEQTEDEYIPSDFVTVCALWRLPWVTIPFVVGMFAMVQALAQAGWLSIWAEWLAVVSRSLGVYGTIFFVAFLTSGACALLNNQPMTILFTQILLHPRFARRVPRRNNYAAMMSLIMGSNFGGDLTLIG